MFKDMKQLLILFYYFIILMDCAVMESSKEPTSEVEQKTTPTNVNLLVMSDSNPALKALWVYRPVDQVSQKEPEYNGRPAYLPQPRFVTRLAKSLNNGYDPYFRKDFFEPFEVRPKPITLVAFKKNGVIPRSLISQDTNSYEVAEMQSPYNYVGQFWQDEPGQI